MFKSKLLGLLKREKKVAVTPDFKTQYPDIDRALSFCYTILSPNHPMSADLIIEANRERADEAHRAIYNLRPHVEPYDVMMARMKALDKNYSQACDQTYHQIE